jgi:hypothetical protein
MAKYTQESYQKDKDLQEELKGFAYSKKWEEREQLKAYWAAHYRADAFIAGGQAAATAKNGNPINGSWIPWSGDHLDDNLSIFAGELAANGIGRVLLDTNQSTAFGKQLAGFSKAGWLITGTEEKEIDDWGKTTTQTFLILQHVS